VPPVPVSRAALDYYEAKPEGIEGEKRLQCARIRKKFKRGEKTRGCISYLTVLKMPNELQILSAVPVTY
jgi:hypothetical protein